MHHLVSQGEQRSRTARREGGGIVTNVTKEHAAVTELNQLRRNFVFYDFVILLPRLESVFYDFVILLPRLESDLCMQRL